MSDTPKSQAMVKYQDFAVAVNGKLKEIQSILPAWLDLKRFCRIAVNCLARNPQLLNCDKSSFVLAVMNAAEAGLEPTRGQAAIIPYGGVAQFQPMYQGLIDLAWRGNDILIHADVVREGDTFRYVSGTAPEIEHVPGGEGKRGEKRGAYAVATLKDGRHLMVYMGKDEIDAVKSRSKASKTKESPWNADEFSEGEMWKKTAIIRLYKILPKSRQMEAALDADNRGEAGEVRLPDAIDIASEELPEASVPGTEKVITMPQAKTPATPAAPPPQQAPPAAQENTDSIVEDILMMYDPKTAKPGVTKFWQRALAEERLTETTWQTGTVAQLKSLRMLLQAAIGG